MNVFEISWLVLKESRQMKITDFLAGLKGEESEEEDPYEDIWDEMEEDEDAPPPPAFGGLGGLGPGKVAVASRELEPLAEKVAVVDSKPRQETHLKHPEGGFRYLGPTRGDVAVKPKTEVKSDWKEEQEAKEADLTDEERQARVADIVGRSIREIQHGQLAEGVDVNVADSPALTPEGKEIARQGDETGGRRMEPWLSNAPCDQCGKYWKDWTAGKRTTCTLCTKAKEQGKLAERLDKLYEGSNGRYGRKREVQPEEEEEGEGEQPKITDWIQRLSGGGINLGGLGSD